MNLSILKRGRELVNRQVHGWRSVLITNISTTLIRSKYRKYIIFGKYSYTGTLTYSATSNNYDLSIQFEGVPLTSISTNQVLSATDVSQTKVRCNCSCPDFYYVYAPYTDTVTPVTRYQSKGTKSPRSGLRPSPNPGRYPGMCKHLLVFARVLKLQRKLIDTNGILG